MLRSIPSFRPGLIGARPTVCFSVPPYIRSPVRLACRLLVWVRLCVWFRHCSFRHSVSIACPSVRPSVHSVSPQFAANVALLLRILSNGQISFSPCLSDYPSLCQSSPGSVFHEYDHDTSCRISAATDRGFDLNRPLPPRRATSLYILTDFIALCDRA